MNKVRISVICFAVIFSIAAVSWSQTPGATKDVSPAGLDFLADADSLPAAFSSEAQADAGKYVKEKGWESGRPMPDGRFVAIGSSTIAVPPSSDKFQQSRGIAFTKAMLDAKAQIATTYSLSIATEVSHSYGEGSPVKTEQSVSSNSSEQETLVSKARAILNADLDAALKKRGVEPKSKEAEKAVAEMLDPVNKSAFSQTITRMAQATVGALVVSKIFEDSGEVVVVATYSPATKQLAASMMGQGHPPKVNPRTDGLTVGAWIETMTVADLYPSYGVQLTSDEIGNLVIVSYGQAFAQTDSSMSAKNAESAAAANADGYIRSFVGEAVQYKNNKQEMEDNKEFDNGTIEVMVNRVQDTKISSVASTLKIPGIVTAKTWKTQDKRSGKLIVGVVRRWDFSSAVTAVSERDEFNKVNGGAGGQGISSAQAGQSSESKPANSSQEIVPVGSGEKYKHQSRSSEDF